MPKQDALDQEWVDYFLEVVGKLHQFREERPYSTDLHLHIDSAEENIGFLAGYLMPMKP